jgi:hypothetical protein
MKIDPETDPVPHKDTTNKADTLSITPVESVEDIPAPVKSDAPKIDFPAPQDFDAILQQQIFQDALDRLVARKKVK